MASTFTQFKLCNGVFWKEIKLIAYHQHSSLIVINQMSTLSPPSLGFFLYKFNHLNYSLLLLLLHSIFYELVICSSLFVIPKLDGEPVADTAEGGGLHLPVVDGVAIQADAVVERPLHPKATRAEVIHGHMVDVVGMEIDHLQGRSADESVNRSMK